MTGSSSPARRVRSIDNFVTLLRHFGPDRPTVTLSETVELLSIHKSSASRLLRQLADHGLLRRLDRGTTYGVGARLFEVGNLYRLDDELLQRCGPTLDRLVDETGLTAQLCLREGARSVVVASRESPRLIRAAANLGGRLPLDRTASGRVLLMHLPDDAISALTGGHDETPALPMEEVVARVRESEVQGGAIVVGEYQPDLFSVAAPVHEAVGEVRAALCVVSAAVPSAIDRAHDLLAIVQREAVGLTDKLSGGHSPPVREGARPPRSR